MRRDQPLTTLRSLCGREMDLPSAPLNDSMQYYETTEVVPVVRYSRVS